jgi:glycosyltransferase involved in cell wall biosynthesis
LVNPLSSREIAQAICWLLEHPREAAEMGRRGAEAVRTQYNWEIEEGRLLHFYQQLTNGHKI